MAGCTVCYNAQRQEIIDPVHGVVRALCAKGAGFVYFWRGLAWKNKPSKPFGFMKFAASGLIDNCPKCHMAPPPKED